MAHIDRAARIAVASFVCHKHHLELVFLGDFPCSGRQAHRCCETRNVALVHDLLAGGENVKEKVRGDYPLNAAELFGSVEIARILLEAAQTLTCPDGTACIRCTARSLRGTKRVVALLLSKGAVVDSRDRLGLTPLITFADNGGGLAIARMLLRASADAKAVDVDLISALSVADQLGNVELGNLMIESGADINHADVPGETPPCLRSSTGDMNS